MNILKNLPMVAGNSPGQRTIPGSMKITPFGGNGKKKTMDVAIIHRQLTMIHHHRCYSWLRSFH
jgi:hypothetical protein